jgi:hypothetical protein
MGTMYDKIDNFPNLPTGQTVFRFQAYIAADLELSGGIQASKAYLMNPWLHLKIRNLSESN